MARPKKPINYEDEFLRIDAQITKHRKSIEELEQMRKELLKEKEQAEISQLYEFYKSSGMSIEELISLVSDKSNDKIKSA